MYGDFECLTNKINTCLPKKDRSFSHKYQKHEPMSFTVYIKYKHADYKAPITYRGPNATKLFFDTVKAEALAIKNIYNKKQPIKMTTEDEEHFQRTHVCHICDGDIRKKPSPYSPKDEPDFRKVRDHDHLLDPAKCESNYRGPAHNLCNLKYQEPSFIPVFIHNLSGYDAHLFIKELGGDKGVIDVIPNNEERYISFSKEVGAVMVEGDDGKQVKVPGIKLRFVDSFKFMAASVDSLAKNVKEFRETVKYFPKDKLDLVTRKGVYPYDYMDSWDKCEETKLPPQEDFYNQLNESHIKDGDYEHAKSVWKAFNIKTLGEYSDLYVKTDVLILADIMEHFRDVCLKTYKLDPAWYFTAPGLSWDAMLKTTEVELQLLTDYDMILMLEKGTRGGISQCCNRYGRANNKYMKDYDENKKSKYLMYLDANNLYGWAMSQYLPHGGFKWSTVSDVTHIADDSDTGYIIDCDLQYPDNLHNLHSDLPLAPESRIPDGSKQPKLLTTLYDKEHYVVHYRVLKQYLQLGLKVKKVHRVLEFKQSPWLKKYIDLNTEMRTKAANDFEKDFYKLMNNSVFGKTMENIRKRLDIRLVCDPKKAEKLVAKPNFKGRTIFDERLAAVHMNKTKVIFNKPIYVGMSILDLSKHLMYDFHYNLMKPKYRDDIKLLYMDTDSYIYDIQTEDFYQDMKGMIDYFDTSDYPENNRYGMPRVNKKVLGKMKDENAGKILEEFVGLRSKMYACKTEKELIKKSKGVKKCVVKNRISFEDYKSCLFSQEVQYRTMHLIRSTKHEIHSIQVNKIALSGKDDKRHILEDGVHTLALGHYAIKNEKSEK
ncbi:hypothetical protein AVEN_195153-1 [Araneus ventricosus]|uniref:DNA-directed DNA polymerase n=1 Tax=Araneus ventricosus TaxID=182803 RepID=A0A4Y2GLE2_ARAVE|nr:hypothetical protein AVEN_195153-1 [Araneus ventricosus]